MSSTSTSDTDSDSGGTSPSPSPPPVRRKKKTSKRNELKWFKGPTNKNRTRTPKKLLKHAQKESSPQQLPIPARIVEFDIDGHTERLGVSEILSIIDRGNVNYDLPQTPDMADDSSNSAFPNSQFSGTPLTANSKVGKGKGTLKRPKPKVISTPKITTNPNNNWNISENSESNSNSAPNKLPEGNFSIMDGYKSRVASPMPNSYIRYMEKHPEELENEVEYDIDEEDYAWLELVNDKRQEYKLHPVLPEDMEFLLDRLEKESYFQMQSTGMEQAPLIDDDAVCCICMDGECQNSNAILFCDMCNLAVHQECYGVPYIPEGQWLCRRCLQSPSRAVDCALCPNKGGAFKQTDDGRWAHVICAIWIPEVCFANTVFLEPIDSVSNIPAARWRLCCYICKQKGVGACIQCQKTNCYTAFHVTCAQQANLCMNMDTVVEGNAVIVKKTAYCDHHAPPDERKLKQTRKMLAEKRCAVPVVSIPTIPSERMEEISNDVHFLRKHQFIKRLMSYWKLKRQQRNGVPLIRRLQAASTASASTAISNRDENRPSEFGTTTLNYYHYWVRMRQDLEKARLLCELIRKRERLKRSFVHLKHQEVNLTLKPFNSILLNVVDELMARDVSEIFCEPVDPCLVVDYLDVIKNPMDLSTIKEKVNSFEYLSIDELEKDFDLMIRNCLMYNGKDTIFYKAGLRLRELGGVVIRQARRLINSIGFDRVTGMHLEHRVCEIPVLEDGDILKKVEDFLENEERFTLPLEKHLMELQNLMDQTLALTHPLKRKNRFAKVRNEIIRLRKLKNYNEDEDPATCFKEYLDSKHNSFFLTESDPNCPPMLNCDPAIELFRVGISPAKRVERAQEQDSRSSPAYETRTPAMQRSNTRPLRPLKRKILTESPLKDSPVKEPPVKEKPPKSRTGLFTCKSVPNLRIVNRNRRSSVSPTRKSQRISSAQDTQAQQIEQPVVNTPAKSSVSPTNKATPSPPKISRQTALSPDITFSRNKTISDDLAEQKKSRNSASESLASPVLNNSLEHEVNNFDGYDDDGDFHKSQPVPLHSRSPSPDPSNKSSSGSSISSLIRFDAPEIRFDRIGTHHEHEPGTIPIIVSPSRPIEVITTYSSSDNRNVGPGKHLYLVKQGSNIFVPRNERCPLFDDDSSDHDDDSDLVSPAKSNVKLKSPSSIPKKTDAANRTPSNLGKISNQFQTPESQKLKPFNSKRKPGSSANVTPTSANSSAGKGRVISFTSPSPLKTSSPARKSPKTESKGKNKLRENAEPVIARLTVPKVIYQPLSPDVTDFVSPKKNAATVSPESKKRPKLSTPKTPKNRSISQKLSTPPSRKASPFLASTGKKAGRPPSKQVATPKKTAASSRGGSPTKSSPRTPKNKIVKKRLSMSETSPTKQKKPKLITSGQNRLSRSLSQNEYRCQSRSPSITSIVRREPAGGLKNKPMVVNNVTAKQRVSVNTPITNSKVDQSNDKNPVSFKAYRAATGKEPDSSSDHEDGSAPEKDKGGRNQEIDSEEEKNKKEDERNGACSPLVLESLLTLEQSKGSPSRNTLQRTESAASEGILCLAPIKALSSSNNANKMGPTKPTVSDMHVLTTLNINERAVPSPESDVLDLTDAEGPAPQINNNPALTRYENFKPQMYDLVWAVYEFRSWFPAMVINPEGPFGQIEHGHKIIQPPPEVILRKPMNTDPWYLVSYFEVTNHWKWVEANQVKPLSSDNDVDTFFLNAKSMLDLKEVKKAYERALIHRGSSQPPDTPAAPATTTATAVQSVYDEVHELSDPDDINGELLDID